MPLTCLISCANWNNSSNAGVWYVNWNNTRSNSNNNVGGRSDYDFSSRPAGKWNHRDGISCATQNMFTPVFLVGLPTIRTVVTQ